MPTNISKPVRDSFGERIEAARRGLFSIDLPSHRAKRATQAHARALIEAAYRQLGMDRTAEHNAIAASMEARLTNGVWARSTGEYSTACHALDAWVLDVLGEQALTDVQPDPLRAWDQGLDLALRA